MVKNPFSEIGVGRSVGRPNPDLFARGKSILDETPGLGGGLGLGGGYSISDINNIPVEYGSIFHWNIVNIGY